MIDIKRKLRNQIRTEQKSLSDATRKEIDARLIQNVLGHDLYQNCSRLFLYASSGYEIDTHGLIRYAYEEGKQVGLPKCQAEGIMEFYSYTGELKEGMYRIPEPTGTDVIYPQEKDVMIVPGLSFDKRGYRLGQGGGYYDRYLSKHACICVGLCRELYLMKELPVMWNDLPVDYVITENAVYNCKNGASEEAPLS